MTDRREDRLGGLYRGFRERYLDHETLTAQIRGWAEAFPDLVRLESVGRSGEGRDLWVLTIGPEPDRTRPAVWVDANLHALEVAGSSVALALAEDVLRLHLEPLDELHGLAPHVREQLRDVLFHVMPRISPDGAEAVLKSGRYVRSVPRDARTQRSRPRWVQADVDGDGEIHLMRRRDPAGEWVESSTIPGVLVRRGLEDPPPWYKVWPEGFIEGFDGCIPDPSFLSDNFPDLNRNFPWRWAPEPHQIGAGEFPGSEPESRAVLEFAAAHPSIFAWLDLHTFGGVLIRPPGDGPDITLDRDDLAVYREVEAWAESLTGYPTVSAYEGYTYVPGQPLRGDIVEYAYRQRGCLAVACEIWDLFEELGIPRQPHFVDTYAHFGREEMERLARWDAEHNAGRIIRPWRPVHHPQLGDVEVGGVDARVGLWNPPYERLPGIASNLSALWLRVSALLPRLELDPPETHALGEGVHRVAVAVRNVGYLPTFGVGGARDLPWNEPLTVVLELDGPTLAGRDPLVRTVRHLDGWGRGRHGDADGPVAWPNRGGTSSRTVEWVVKGSGRLRFVAGSARLGRVERRFELP